MRTNRSLTKRKFVLAAAVLALAGLAVSGISQAADFSQRFYQKLPG